MNFYPFTFSKEFRGHFIIATVDLCSAYAATADCIILLQFIFNHELFLTDGRLACIGGGGGRGSVLNLAPSKPLLLLYRTRMKINTF